MSDSCKHPASAVCASLASLEHRHKGGCVCQCIVCIFYVCVVLERGMERKVQYDRDAKSTLCTACGFVIDDTQVKGDPVNAYGIKRNAPRVITAPVGVNRHAQPTYAANWVSARVLTGSLGGCLKCCAKLQLVESVTWTGGVKTYTNVPAAGPGWSPKLSSHLERTQKLLRRCAKPTRKAIKSASNYGTLAAGFIY
eukprot:7743048-Pyramimonas_sp.AAC.1